MAPINRLTCLVLLATSGRGCTAASTPSTERRLANRVLLDEVVNYAFTDASGNQYIVEYFEDDSGTPSEFVLDSIVADVIIVDLDEEGHMKTAEQGVDMYGATYKNDDLESVTSMSDGRRTTRRRTEQVGFPGRQLLSCNVRKCTFFLKLFFVILQGLCQNAGFQDLNTDLCAAPIPSLADISAICLARCDDDVFDDPHMKGLRGQKIDWSGVDGGWYSLIKDDNADLYINARVTAPLPDEFPDRQLMTSLAVMSEGHSVVIEVKSPYTIDTDGCPEGVSPCLANGGLRLIVDDQEVDELLRFSREVPVAEGAMTVSASNLPVECRQFGGDRIWARTYQAMMEGRRLLLGGESLEEWILRYKHNMAAPEWCAKYIAENDLADLQSNHAIFKIQTPTVTVRLNAGVNYQGNGELNWDGRVLPDLEFWQMDVGMDGLDVDNPALSGLLGETAHPVFDKNGQAVMTGFDAFRGTVEDYRVSGALGAHFPLLDEKVEGHE